MKHPRATVFAGAIISLSLMHIMASFFGYATTVIPRGTVSHQRINKKPTNLKSDLYLTPLAADLSKSVSRRIRIHMDLKWIRIRIAPMGFHNTASRDILCCSVKPFSSWNSYIFSVLRIRIWIRISRIHMFLGLPHPDPDLLVRDTDPSIIKQK